MKIPGIAMLRKIKFFQAGSSRGWFMSIFMITLILLFAGVAFGSSGGEAKGWVKTDTYRVMNFAVLAGGLFLLLRKPVAQALNDRIKGIKDQLSELEAKEKSAEKELAEYNKKLLMLDTESEKIVAEYIKQGNEAKERILREAESASEKLEEQAKRNIEHAFKQAKLQLQEEIVEKALEKAEDIIKTEITFEDQDRLVDEYLEKVVA
ncbi:MAG: ATP synthase F0 subunit B [Desulfobacteraceae bacterium]|nr:ATP synthase F0 subunit B [Desulfobacteraceae bacterium]